MRILVSDHFLPLFDVASRYLVMYGGRGSGKSEFVGRKIFKRCMEEGGHQVLITRKVARDNDESTMAVMRSILEENDVAYNHNRTKKILSFYSPSGKLNVLFFDGMDNRERIKSKKGISMIWCEEATELSEADFLQIDLILRDPFPFYKQIILSFNPDEAQAEWIKERFFEDETSRVGPGKDPDSYLHWSTIDHNPIKAVRDEYTHRLDGISDAVYHKIYREGVWAIARGIIYYWDVQPLPNDDCDWYDEIWYGGDFGYSVDPAALVRIYRKADEFWVEQVIYSKNLTNQDLGREMRQAGIVDEDVTYWDSSEPKSIQELFEQGFNAQRALKRSDSVRAGIDYLKGLKIHIVDGSKDIISERKKYKWQEDKDGKLVNKPVEFDNHAMDAIRYGIYTHMRLYGGGAGGFEILG